MTDIVEQLRNVLDDAGVLVGEPGGGAAGQSLGPDVRVGSASVGSFRAKTCSPASSSSMT